MLPWRLGPRRGALALNPAGIKPGASNYGLVVVGVLFIMFSSPFVTLDLTWIFTGKGVYGISMTQTGVGLILVNIFCALLSGGVVGSIVA